MAQFFEWVRHFFSELRRRNVYRVAATYIVVGFFVIEAADLTLTRLDLPPWTVTLVIVLVGLGFPIALVMAWALEVTPEGVQVEETAAKDTEGPGDIPTPAGTTRDVWVGASILALLLLGGWWIFGGLSSETGSDTSANTAVDSSRVVIFPFTTRGGEGITYLGEGMVDLMDQSIDGAGPLRTVDPKMVLARVDEKSPSGLSPDSARKIAAEFGAGRFVLGSVLKLGETIQVSGTWYSIQGNEIGSAEVEGQGKNDIQQMVDDLARSAITDLTGGRAEPRRRLAAQTTSSAEALKAYLEGQEAFRALDYNAAMEAFSEAVEIDSTFALAHHRLSFAAAWYGRLRLAHRAGRRAVEFSESLPTRDRRLVRAAAAHFEGGMERAERLFRIVLQNNPSDVWGQYMLGEVLFHYNGVRGRPVTEARSRFRYAMELDPTFTEPLVHRIQIALLERDSPRLDSMTTGLDELGLAPTLQAAYGGVRSYVLSDGPDAALQKRLRKSFLTVWQAAYPLLAGERLQAAVELVQPFSSSDRPDEMRAAALEWEVDLLAGQGKLGAARERIQSIAPLDSATYWMARARLATLPFVPDGDLPERRAVRNGLVAWNAEATPERLLPALYLLPRELYPAGRLYRLGLLQAQTGNIEGAVRAARNLDEKEGWLLARSAPPDFARSIRAEVDRREGDAKEALDHLTSRENRVSQTMVLLRLHSGARERFLRAQLLAQQGRLEDALTWYRTLNGIAVGDVAYLAPAHLGRARVLEKLGRSGDAATAYRRALEIWEDPDPLLQPSAEEARRRLARLEERTGTVSATDSQSNH